MFTGFIKPNEVLFIEYNVIGSGWATVRIGNNETSIEISVSYLNDSLKELAKSAIAIKKCVFEKVVFMDEPGEHILLLNRKNDTRMEYELRWYSEYDSWSLINEDNFTLELKGEITMVKYVNQVRNILIDILREMNLEEYKERWINHQFPIDEYIFLK